MSVQLISKKIAHQFIKRPVLTNSHKFVKCINMSYFLNFWAWQGTPHSVLLWMKFLQYLEYLFHVRLFSHRSGCHSSLHGHLLCHLPRLVGRVVCSEDKRVDATKTKHIQKVPGSWADPGERKIIYVPLLVIWAGTKSQIVNLLKVPKFISDNFIWLAVPGPTSISQKNVVPKAYIACWK